MSKDQSNGTSKNIDRIDCEIVRLLQDDGRMPNTEIAKKIGIAESTVRIRLKRLISEGYIQIVAVSDPVKLGFTAVGSLRIFVDVSKLDYVTQELKKIKSLWFITHSTGDADIYTEFVAKSIGELNDILSNQIYKIDGIRRTNTSMVLKIIKRRYDWGTAIDELIEV